MRRKAMVGGIADQCLIATRYRPDPVRRVTTFTKGREALTDVHRTRDGRDLIDAAEVIVQEIQRLVGSAVRSGIQRDVAPAGRNVVPVLDVAAFDALLQQPADEDRRLDV